MNDYMTPWERNLLLGKHSEGVGKVTFTRLDGNTVVIDFVKVDSIGVDVGQEKKGVTTLTKEDETIVHLPFIESWTIDYRC